MRDVDGLEQLHRRSLADADDVARCWCCAAATKRRYFRRCEPLVVVSLFAACGAPDHVGRVRAEADAAQSRSPLSASCMVDGAIGPTGDEERLAVGMEQDAIRTAAGLEALDDAAGLRIDHDDGVAKQIGGVDAGGRPGETATSPMKSFVLCACFRGTTSNRAAGFSSPSAKR